MKIINCEQNTPEWYNSRVGIPTASSFSKILSATGKPSTSADGYANDIMSEVVAGKPLEGWSGNEWSERGKELESDAVAWYEFTNDVDTKEVGFCKADNDLYGCSPDRLIDGDEGLLEVKCPKGSTHLGYLLKNQLPTTYIPQVQGQLLVTGRKWCDFLSYHPDMPKLIVRVERDEEYITKLSAALASFHTILSAKKAKLIKLGYLTGEST